MSHLFARQHLHSSAPGASGRRLHERERGGRRRSFASAHARPEPDDQVSRPHAINTTAQHTSPRRQGGEDVKFYVSSGAVNTSGLMAQHTGRWEVRVRMPLVGKSPGYTLHSSIWLFANERRPGNSGCPQEIDVIEQYR